MKNPSLSPQVRCYLSENYDWNQESARILNDKSYEKSMDDRLAELNEFQKTQPGWGGLSRRFDEQSLIKREGGAF